MMVVMMLYWPLATPSYLPLPRLNTTILYECRPQASLRVAFVGLVLVRRPITPTVLCCLKRGADEVDPAVGTPPLAYLLYVADYRDTIFAARIQK